MYAVSAETRGIEKVLHLLSSTVLQPMISEYEIEEAGRSILFEKEDMEMRPEQEAVIMEMLHRVAWGNSTLGHPKFCPDENIDRITRDHILKLLQTYFIPSRMIVCGVGVEHQELVDITKEYFDFSQATWNVEKFKGCDDPIQPDDSKAIYQGGILKVLKLSKSNSAF